jgi:hypothetical protein
MPEVINFEQNGYYDDGSGPAAMPPAYGGFSPSAPIEEPGGMRELVIKPRPLPVATRITPAAPVLIDAPTGGGGIAANAPKVPETPAAAATVMTPTPGGAPVLRAGEEVTVVKTTTETRVMVTSLVLLALVVAYIAWKESRE